jgi:AI-2 transport protein TqsA
MAIQDGNSFPRGTYILFTFAAFVITIAGMRAAASLLVPFLLSIVIAIISAPPLFWLKRKGLPTALAVVIVVVTFLVVVLLIITMIGTSLSDFSRTIPLYQQHLQEKSVLLLVWLEGAGIDLTDKEVFEAFNPGVAMKMAAGLLTGLKSVLANGFLILFTVIFILLEASSVPAKLRGIFSDPDSSLGYLEKISDSVQRYFAVKTIISLGTGIAVTLWLYIIGVDYPLLWGLLAFLFNYIPNIGSILAAVPAVLLALVQLGTGSVILVVVGYLVINISVGNIIEPRVMGRSLGLSTLVVFLSLIFWGWVFGPVGMLLSAPLTMTVKIALDSNDETRWLSILLGSEASSR